MLTGHKSTLRSNGKDPKNRQIRRRGQFNLQAEGATFFNAMNVDPAIGRTKFQPQRDIHLRDMPTPYFYPAPDPVSAPLRKVERAGSQPSGYTCKQASGKAS